MKADDPNADHPESSSSHDRASGGAAEDAHSALGPHRHSHEAGSVMECGTCDIDLLAGVMRCPLCGSPATPREAGCIKRSGGKQ